MADTDPTFSHDRDLPAQGVVNEGGPHLGGYPPPSAPPLPDGSIRALIVDGHPASRLGLALILRRQPWVAGCLLAGDGLEAKALVALHRPEVALLDISNAGPFVAASIASLQGGHPGMSIVLTSRCAVTLPAPAHTLGAAAFLPARTGTSEIVAAVRAAVLSLQPPDPAPAGPSDVELTERERQILLMISEGATNREIAGRLHLGPDSIKKNASALYRKLGVRNRIEAAQYASSLFGLGRD